MSNFFLDQIDINSKMLRLKKLFTQKKRRLDGFVLDYMG